MQFDKQCVHLFYWIGNCSYSSGILTEIALIILGVLVNGFTLLYIIGKKLVLYWYADKKIVGIQLDGFEIVSVQI